MAKGHTNNSALGLRPKSPRETERRVLHIGKLMSRNRYNDRVRDELAEEWGLAPSSVSSMASEASRRNAYSSEEDAEFVRIIREEFLNELEAAREMLMDVANEERANGKGRLVVDALNGIGANIGVAGKISGIDQKGAAVQVLFDQRGEPTGEAKKFVRDFVTGLISCVCAECRPRVLEMVKAQAASDVAEVKGEVER